MWCALPPVPPCTPPVLRPPCCRSTFTFTCDLSLFDPLREKVTYMTTKQKMCDAFKARKSAYFDLVKYGGVDNCLVLANGWGKRLH